MFALQRKRLELARSLATHPRLLLLDEVAGGLTDPEMVQLADLVRDTLAAGVAVLWVEHVVRALLGTVQRLICLAAGRIIGGELPNSEHVFDVSLGQAYALRRLGPASVRLAASRAFDRLSRRFGSTNPAKWRAPRAKFDWSIQGAESPAPMPFFDRGTFEQFVELAGG